VSERNCFIVGSGGSNGSLEEGFSRPLSNICWGGC
jgi:hypothetical protein